MKHIEDLLQKYPELLQNAFDISHPPGWNPIVESLCSCISSLILFETEPELFYVQQIKQKFGGLRFYMSQETPQMTEAIQMAEGACVNVCEMCGEPGKHHTVRGWLATMCDKHAEEWANRK